MKKHEWRAVLAASVCVIGLAACSGGGGGGSPVAASPAPVTSTPAPVTPAPAASTNTLIAPVAASTHGGAPTFATGATSNFASSPKGTSFAFNQTVLDITLASATPASIGGATITVLDPNSQGAMQLRFSIPALGIETTHLPLRGVDDGLPAGGVVLFDMSTLDYTMFGRWLYNTDPRTFTRNYQGYATAGYQTMPSGVPSSGAATYFGAGTAQVAIVQQSNPQGAFGALYKGDTTLNVNFSSGTLTGTLSNIATGSTNWHDVGLSGSISGGTISGTTSIGSGGATPSINAFSSNSTGNFNGAFYGPNAQEAGAVWTLADPKGTQAAYGVFAGKKTVAGS